MTTYQFKIQGMHCVDCAHTVEQALSTVPGVTTAKVHYLKKQATVDTTMPVSLELFTQAVENAGYTAIPRNS